ncbi:hypothetical protein CO610_06765 [Lysobacteraceae bacterium NML95-0200]|nr:hypothetical protein CO610_06765 [Xanthomonadaceae bacterium NML95-0200]
MSNKAEIRTVLLARPGEAREQLVAVLQDAGLDLVLVANPLDIGQAQVLALQPHNLVIVVDSVVEDALEHFDELLALPDCRILFEEAELIATRAGWDMARWSRHLSAKLLGHGDVLPAGHEVDTATGAAAKPAASHQAAKTTMEDMAQAAEPEIPLAEPFEPEPVVDVTPVVEAPAGLPPVLQPVADSVQQSLAELPVVAEAPEGMAAAPASAVSDYTDYDELDAFSFLDQQAIEAAQARDAEAAAIREAEAATEASLLAGHVEDGGLDTEALDTLWFQQQDIPDSGRASQSADGMAQPDTLMPPSPAVQAPQSPLDEDAFAFGDVLFAAEASPIVAREADCTQSPEPAETGEISAALPEGWSFLPESGETAESSPADMDSGADWSIYQDFDTVTAISGEALADSATATDTVEDPVSAEREALTHEDAYQRIADELSRFEAPQRQDSWQDFEPPASEAEAVPQISEKKPPEPLESPFAGGVSQWSLSDISLTIDEGKKRPAFDNKRLNDLEQRISSLALVKTEEEIEVETRQKQHEGTVLIIGGIGGPDPLRHILQQLPKDFPVPVLVQQWLDAGSYDRLQRQMERVSSIPVVLAVPGMEAEDSTVYIVPSGVGLTAETGKRLRFTQVDSREFANLLNALPSISSAAVLLSGASDAFVEPLLRFQQGGGKLLAQSEEGCYDHAMPALMASHGAKLDSPIGIAMQLKALWSTTELK